MLRKIRFWLFIVAMAALIVQIGRVVEIGTAFPLNQGSLRFAEPVAVAPLPPEQAVSLRKVLLYSDEDHFSRQVKDNALTTLAMAKIPVTALHVSSLEVADVVRSMDSSDVLILATEHVAQILDYRVILDYVHRGGNLVVLKRTPFTFLNSALGIVDSRGFAPNTRQGIVFVRPIFPGLDEVMFEPLTHSSLLVQLKPEARVLATCMADHPLIWQYSYGLGRSLYVNSSMLSTPLTRGLLLQLVLHLPDVSLATVFNALVFGIDDFPAPVKFGRHPLIFPQYALDTNEFFRQIWWPEMYNLARRHNVAFTGLAMVTFNDATTPPLPPPLERDMRWLHFFGRKLSEAGGELGLHGYNHQSLTLAGQMDHAAYGYTPWQSQAAMEEGLVVLREWLRASFGDVSFHAYVPPSNIVGREGRLAVANVFPEVRMFAGVYGQSLEPGVLGQEFGRDPYVPRVVSFPRMSNGYLDTPQARWEVFNGLAHFGLVHHFIHPDDLFDPLRSGGHLWEEMYRQLDSLLAAVRRDFPFLRPMTMSQAYIYFRQTENLTVRTELRPDRLVLSYNQSGVPVYHFLRLRDKRISLVEGGSFQRICSETDLYLIEGEAAQVTVFWRQP